MSDFIETMQDVVNAANSNISEVITQLKIDCSNDVETISQEIESLLDSNAFNAPDIVYYAEAWGIVAGSAFNAFDPFIDFSDCSNALECVMREANEIITEAYNSVLHDRITETAETIHEVIEAVIETGGDKSIDLVFGGSTCHGWAVHNRETEAGIAIYDDKPGHYNPEKLEGELYAVEGSVGAAYVSACWNPNDYE